MAPRTTSVAQLQVLIRGIQSGFSAYYALVLVPYGISFPQFAVLLCLARQRPLKMSEVAVALRVSLPAVTNLVDRLERKGFLRRKAHPKDRRVTLLDLTPKGLGVVAKTQGRTMGMLTRVFLKKRPAERAAIFDFMEGMSKGLAEVIDDAKADA